MKKRINAEFEPKTGSYAYDEDLMEHFGKDYLEYADSIVVIKSESFYRSADESLNYMPCTVGELINALSKYDKNLEVVTYDGSYFGIIDIGDDGVSEWIDYDSIYER